MAAAPSPELVQASVAANLANIIAAPGEVAEQVYVHPPRVAHWLVPALLLAMVGTLMSWLTFSQPAIRQQLKETREKAVQKMVEQGQVKAEDAAKGAEARERLAPMIMLFLATVGSLIDGFARPFLAAAILWLLAAKGWKIPLPYMKVLDWAGICSVVLVLGRIVDGLLAITFSNLFMRLSPSLLLANLDLSNPWHMFLLGVDVFSLWYLMVIALGLARLASITFRRSLGWTLAIWLGWRVLSAAVALLMQR